MRQQNNKKYISWDDTICGGDLEGSWMTGTQETMEN